MTISEAAATVGVSAETLRRWLREGVVPEYEGAWDAAAVGNAKLVARLRERGYTLAQIRAATEQGRLAFSRVLALFEDHQLRRDQTPQTVRQAARRTGLDPETVNQVAAALGVAPDAKLDATVTDVLAYVAAGLRAGLPQEALLQITRVYVQATAQIADAEVRLVHLYMHEPLMRSGGPAHEMAEELHAVAEQMLPLSQRLLEHLHMRTLLDYIEQDLVGHMEMELPPAGDDVGRMLVAIAFVDLAGYTELTDREGDQHALDVVEQFLAAVNQTIPGDARVIKTIGDAVMIVGTDPIALTAWALALEAVLPDDGPRPRAAVHYGHARYRDGDFYGREVNLAARVQSQSADGEVLVTRAVVEAGVGELRFEPLADVQLRGFSESTELYRAQLGLLA